MIGGKCLCFRAKAAHISGHLPIVIQLFTDAADFFAVRQNMLGIKARAEGVAPISQAILNTEAALNGVRGNGDEENESCLVFAHQGTSRIRHPDRLRRAEEGCGNAQAEAWLNVVHFLDGPNRPFLSN